MFHAKNAKSKTTKKASAWMENAALTATVPLWIAELIVLGQIENRRRIRAVS